MAAAKQKQHRKGAALLAVLLIVITITIVTLGFLSSSDMELASAANVPLRMQMDYLAQSGLEHAKALIINPQEVDTTAGYWQGGTGLQIAGGDDYYDLSITQSSGGATPACTYAIDCSAYRLNGADKLARSRVAAVFRLDPFIAYYQGGSQKLLAGMTVNGDVYVGDKLEVEGVVNGDGFSASDIVVAGTLTGSRSANLTESPVKSPNIIPNYDISYYYNGGGPYSVMPLAGAYDGTFPGPGINNPAHVYYCSGNLDLTNVVVNINGTLVVDGDLHLKEGSNVTITSFKNMPALVVGNSLDIDKESQRLVINGYGQVGDHIDLHNKAGASITVTGALYVLSDGVKNLPGANSVTVTGDPVMGSLKIWNNLTLSKLWTPAGGGFFKTVTRTTP